MGDQDKALNAARAFLRQKYQTNWIEIDSKKTTKHSFGWVVRWRKVGIFQKIFGSRDVEIGYSPVVVFETNFKVIPLGTYKPLSVHISEIERLWKTDQAAALRYK